ncbi:MAG: AI-2E family transporter [Nocardiaceae bacterium]|nr:AI-2E family transporter [Nocardiaceae bacterium]
MWVAKWCAALLVIAGALWVLGLVVAKLWSIILPIVLAAIVATVLWPVVKLLVRFKVPSGAAAAVATLGFIGVLVGVVALIVPSVVDQAPELANKAAGGIAKIQDWLHGPPLNLDDSQLSTYTDAIVDKLQSSASQIASGVFSGVGAVTSALVNLVVVLFLAFFFVKDGPRFLPWLHSVVGSGSGAHFEVVLYRIWNALGGFIRTQAVVSFIDAVMIGLGLVILDVPLALALTVITFLGGFVPIVGALVAGALAALVALVANGLTTALIVLAIIAAVQQIEGNVLQPILQSRSLNLHAAIVLLAVTAGGSLWGIIGVFLAVPAASVAAVILRYLGEQLDKRAAPPPPLESEPELEDVAAAT